MMFLLNLNKNTLICTVYLLKHGSKTVQLYIQENETCSQLTKLLKETLAHM